jgi:tRNA pseudouridine13 synthase
MILKQQPDDFFVEELTRLVPGENGPFSLYRLDKRGWTTPDALQQVRRRWKIEPRRLSYGGLKDRHAHTVQHISILRGPRRNMHHPGITITYLGQIVEPFTSRNIEFNRFRMVLRAVSAAEVDHAQAALAELTHVGLPNYFDDQRFGSVIGHGDFLAKAIMLGEYERALRLALAAPYTHDRGSRKKEKAILNTHWGDWAACKENLPRSHARSLVDYLLHHPDDFRGAIARLQPELRGLYLSAYQSHLWNRMLVAWLRTHLAPEQLFEVPLSMGPYPMLRILEPDQRQILASLVLPLPSARMNWLPDDLRKPIFDRVLAEENLQPDHFKLKGKELRDLFFSRGERAALCMPAELHSSIAEDENHPGKQKLTLAFTLPRGSYATLIVKRITRP